MKPACAKFLQRPGLGAAGTTPGGPAKVSIFASGLLGTINGNLIANTATTGAFIADSFNEKGRLQTFISPELLRPPPQPEGGLCRLRRKRLYHGGFYPCLSTHRDYYGRHYSSDFVLFLYFHECSLSSLRKRVCKVYRGYAAQRQTGCDRSWTLWCCPY